MARSRVPARVLNNMLRDGASHTAQCERCAIGPVVEIPPDDTGCNWKVSVIRGSRCGECLVAIVEFITNLRAEFLLDTGDDMDPTLLTTWAMR